MKNINLSMIHDMIITSLKLIHKLQLIKIIQANCISSKEFFCLTLQDDKFFMLVSTKFEKEY